MAPVGCQQGQLSNLRLLMGAVILSYFYKCLNASTNSSLDDTFLCRHCGREVSHARYITTIPSIQSQSQRNSTILGVPNVLIQLFENPYGKKFEVISSRVADVYKADKSDATATFYPGFAWRLIVCPRCGFHLGWFFQPLGKNFDKDDSNESFYSLILENLLHKYYADSLLVAPKFHNS